MSLWIGSPVRGRGWGCRVGVEISMSLDPKSENCICICESASVSNPHAISQSGKARISVEWKRENESAIEEKSSSSRVRLGISAGARHGAKVQGTLHPVFPNCNDREDVFSYVSTCCDFTAYTLQLKSSQLWAMPCTLSAVPIFIPSTR